MRFFNSIQFLKVLILSMVLWSNNLLASVMNQEGWEAWYQAEVATKMPEPYREFMNPAGARFISDEVRTACFHAPSYVTPPKGNHPTYLTNVFNENLSPFPKEPVTAMIRAFFPCPEGALFIPAQAASNPLTVLTSADMGNLLHFVQNDGTLTAQKIYSFLRTTTKSKNPEHILDRSQVLQGSRVLFANKALLLIVRHFNEFLNAADDLDEEEEAFFALDELGKIKKIEEEMPQVKQFFNGGLETSYHQMKAHQEYKSLAQELNNKRLPLSRLKEKLKKSKAQRLSPKDQELMQKYEQELAQVENRRQKLLQLVPDIHAFENDAHYYLSQVAHLIHDAWQNKNESIFGPHLFAKTLLAYAYQKAQVNVDILDFFQNLIDRPLSKDNPHFQAIKPFNKERYEWLKTATPDTNDSGDLESVSLFLHGQKAFEIDSRDLQLYSTARFDNKSFPNCVETTVLNLLILAGQRGMNVEIDALPGNPIPQLREFVGTYKTPETMNGQTARDDFAAMVSNLPGVFYEKPASSAREKRTYELFSGFKNTYGVLCYLLGIDFAEHQDEEKSSDASDHEASESEDDHEPISLLEAGLKTLFGDTFESFDANVSPIPHTDDLQGQLTLNMANGKKYLWGATDRHAYLEEKVSAGSPSFEHPMLRKENLTAYPSFADQISVKGLSARLHPTETLPVALTKENAWAVAAGLKNSKELLMWYAHALLTEGPRELSTLGLEILSNLLEDMEHHLTQYFGQLNTIKAFSRDDLRDLILLDNDTINLAIGPFKTDGTGNSWESLSATPLIHFLDDPEIMDIARRELQRAITYKLSVDPSVNPELVSLIHAGNQRLLDIICSDDKAWKIQGVGSITLGMPYDFEYRISDPVKLLTNLPNIRDLNLTHRDYLYTGATFAPQTQDVVQQIRSLQTVFEVKEISLENLKTLISWVELNPNLQIPGKRKFIVDFSRSPDNPYNNFSTREKLLPLLSPEAQAFYQGLDKPVHQNLFAKHWVKSDDNTSRSKYMKLKKFFTQDGGEFARKMLYLEDTPPPATP